MRTWFVVLEKLLNQYNILELVTEKQCDIMRVCSFFLMGQIELCYMKKGSTS